MSPLEGDARPDFKQTDRQGGTGMKKKGKGVSAAFVDAKNEKRSRKLKCQSCRTCENRNGYRIEPHHIIRRGAPWFGDWHPDNIMGLCLGCHTDYHSGNRPIKKRIRMAMTRAEVDYTDNLAYQGFADDVYYALPKVNGQTSVGSELAERAA